MAIPVIFLSYVIIDHINRIIDHTYQVSRILGGGIWEGRSSSSPVWGLGAMTQNILKSTLKSRIFRHFLQAEMVSSGVRLRQN